MTKRIAKTPCNGGIYRITCITNDKSYIGSTKHPFNGRWKSHKFALEQKSHANIYLQEDWSQYGELSFEFHSLEPVLYIEDLATREQAWIDIYQACDRNYGFNIATRASVRCVKTGTCSSILKKPIVISSFAKIPSIFKTTRKASGLSLRALSKILEVDYTYISKLENGRTPYPPSDRFITRFAEHFNLDGDRLMLECGRIPVKMQPAIALLVLEKMDSKERRF